MHVVVVGCGRVGSELAGTLERLEHTVAIIDKKKDAFRRLPKGFGGYRIVGFGFDRDTLEEAGVRDAGAVAAVTSGDNSNIMAARVARETFEVDRVVARIYDPRRAVIYQRLGIPTVATVRWTADQVLRRMLPLGATDEYRDPSGRVRLAQLDFHPAWIGRTVRAIEEASPARVAFVSRFGDGVLVTDRTVLQENDVLHVLMNADDAPTVERVLTHAPKTEVE